MLERLVETHDLRKFSNTSSLKKTLVEMFEKEEFLEIVEDKQLFLGLKPKSGSEALYVEDEALINFLRIVRDNLHPWNDLIKVRRSAHKQLNLQLTKSILHDFIKDRSDQYVFKDSSKISKKLHDFDEKMQALHDRLQGVFILSGNKKEAVSSFDAKNSIVFCKINDKKSVTDLCWIKEVRYATVIVLSPDDLPTHKYLKQNDFEKLTIDKKKCKNIWVKNHK
jgi:hypothetical protein